MAIQNTNFPATANINYADAFSYRGPVQATGYRLDYGQAGVVGDDTGILNDRYDRMSVPSGLGSGVLVNAVGRYLYSDEYEVGGGGEPISQFTVVNDGRVQGMSVEQATIYAGANISTVSGWSIDKGIVIESGASYTFGEPGTDIIRNVWAIAGAGAKSFVGGYATHQDKWV